MTVTEEYDADLRRKVLHALGMHWYQVICDVMQELEESKGAGAEYFLRTNAEPFFSICKTQKHLKKAIDALIDLTSETAGND